MRQEAQGVGSIAVVLLATLWVQAVGMAGCLMLAAIAPLAAAQLGLPTGWVGYQVAFVYGAMIPASLVGGQWVRRVGAARASQISLLLVVLGALLMPIGELPVIAAASFLIGTGYGLSNPVAAHLVGRAVVEGGVRRVGLVWSIKQTGVPIGAALAGLIGPPLAAGIGWWSPYLVLALGALATAGLLGVKRAAWDSDADPAVSLRPRPFAGIRLLWSLPGARWISVSAICFMVVQLSFTTFLVSLLVVDVGLGALEAGLLMSLVQVGGLTGRITWGWLADRRGADVPIMMALAVGMAAGCLLLGSVGPATPRPALIAATLLMAVTAVAWNGVYLAALTRRLAPGHTGDVVGASLALLYGSVLVGPPCFALAQAWIGSYTGAQAWMAILPLLSLVSLRLVPGSGSPPTAPPAATR